MVLGGIGYFVYQKIKTSIKPEASVFDSCVKSADLKKYLKKTNDMFNEAFFKESPVPIPLKTNLSNIEIVKIQIAIVGAELIEKPFIKNGKQYCELTDSNISKLFAPIKKENALKYLEFRELNLAGLASAAGKKTILDSKEYEKLGKEIGCDGSKIPLSQKKITKVEEDPLFYFIDWAYFTPMAAAGYYLEKIKIKKDDARIEQVGSETILKCPTGIML